LSITSRVNDDASVPRRGGAALRCARHFTVGPTSDFTGGAMIVRIWKGAVRIEDADAYSTYMQETGIPGYAKTPGNQGV
jgi:hypothetical protein